MTRQVRFTDQTGVKSRETPVPFGEVAARVERQLNRTLTQWATRIHEESSYGRARPKGDTESLSRWLFARIPILKQHGDAGLILYQLVQVVAAGHRAIDAPANRASFPVGPCPELLDAGHDTEGRSYELTECPGAVWAYIPTDGRDLATMRCRTCGAVWYGWQFLRAGKRIVDKAQRTGWRVPIAADG
jgi:hypothetical protein